MPRSAKEIDIDPNTYIGLSFPLKADGNNNFTKANAKKNSANRILYTIYSCGCNETKEKCSSQSNLIVPLEAVVTIVQ